MAEAKSNLEPPTKSAKIGEKQLAHETTKETTKPTEPLDEKDKKYSKKKKDYKKLRYKTQLYEIGSTILIKHEDETNSVAKLKRIIAKGGLPENPEWPTIEVQWYYKKDKINKEKNNIDKSIYDNIGDNELFETDSVAKVFVDTINGNCRVLF